MLVIPTRKLIGTLSEEAAKRAASAEIADVWRVTGGVHLFGCTPQQTHEPPVI